MSQPRIRRTLLYPLGAFLALCGLTSGPATADKDRCRATTTEAIVDEDRGGTIDVYARPGEETVIKFPKEIRLKTTSYFNQGILVEQHTHKISIVPDANIPKSTVAHIRLDTDKPTIIVTVHISEDHTQITEHITVITRTAAERQRERDAAIRARTVRDILSARALCAAPRDSRLRLASQGLFGFTDVRRLDDAEVRDVLIAPERIPIDHAGPNGYGVFLTGKSWILTEGRYFVLFEIENLLRQPYELGRLHAFDEFHFLDHIAAMSLWTEDGQVSEDLLRLDAGERVQGLIELKNIGSIGRYMFMEMSEPDGERPVKSEPVPIEVLPIYELPKSKKVREREREVALAKRTWIGVHGLYGAIWLDDGNPMTGDTDATSLAGFGVRVLKGIFPMRKGPTPMLAFEADLALASSGIASIADVTIDGRQGELQRTAKLVRVQVGGVLRFGDPISAMVRLGVGGQGVSQDSELVTAGGPVPVLDDSFEVTETLYVGGGVDLRFGGGFIAGLGLTLINSGGRRSLEGGLRLEYGLGS